MFPTWPAKSEFGARTLNASPKPPSGGKEFKQLGDKDEDEDSASGFHMGSREASRQLPVGGGFHLKF
jgi:cell division cycle 2-like protein